MRAPSFVLALMALPSVAAAQVTFRCDGQTFAEIADDRFSEPRLGPLIAIFNGKPDAERCEVGRFVRLPAEIPHQTQLGQTIKTVADRFCRGKGAEALLRAENNLPAGEPATDQMLRVPAELEYAAGSRPEAELSAIFGMPALDVIKRYNGLEVGDPLTPGGTIYVPLFLALAPKAKPEPPPVEAARPGALKPRQHAEVARFDRFRHPSHEALVGQVGCAGCHAADPRAPDGYLPVDQKVCLVCHAGFAPTEDVARTERLLLTFGHALHVDPSRKVIKEDQYQAPCQRCHAPSEGGGLRLLPAHAECKACHNEKEAKPVVATDCAGCHAKAESSIAQLVARSTLDETHRGGERKTDIFFGHAAHEKAIGGPTEATCDRCHLAVKKAEALADIPAMLEADCLDCHRGLQKEVNGEVTDLDRCQTCHFSTIAAVAPVFLGLIDKPLGHTRAFRRDHGRVARTDRGQCADCHVELAGESGANCQRCHQQIRPEDHGPRFREDGHGRAATRDPDRCATCHQRERCADCHAEAPRDHFPRQVFQLRHARQARISPRRCLTCHLPAADCGRCHDVATR